MQKINKYAWLGLLLFVFAFLCGCNKSPQKVSQILLSRDNIEVKVDEEAFIYAEVIPTNAEDRIVKWTSSHPDIVDVINGKITGVSPGKAIISAKVGNKISTCMVNVSKVEYTVTFNSNGGSKVSAVSVEAGEQISRPSHPQKEGYIFNGWYLDTNLHFQFNFNTKIDESYTLYAKWIPKTYQINFVTNSLDEISKHTVEYNTYANKPVDPVKEGYDFSGWYFDETLETPFNFSINQVLSDLTLYAKWKKKTLPVTFISNNNEEEKIIKVEWDTFVSKPIDPFKEGHTFKAWYTDANYNTIYNFNTVKVKRELILYAKWEVKSYIISFDSMGGSEVESESVNWNDSPHSKVNPVKEGYKFVSWYVDKNFNQLFDFNNQITKDILLYAKWEINKYQITYDSLGGSEVDSNEVNWNDIINNPDEPVRRGYVFKGWIDEQNNQFDFMTPITSNITLYAKWEEYPLTKKVDFTLDGGRWLIDSYEGFIDEDVFISISLGAYNIKFYDINKLYKTNVFLYSKDVNSSLLINTDQAYKVGIKYDEDGYYYVAAIAEELMNYNFSDYEYTLVCYKDFKEGYELITNIDFGHIITISGANLDNTGLIDGIINVYRNNIKIYYNSGLYDNLDDLPAPVKDGYEFMGWYDVFTNETVNSLDKNTEVYAKWKLN